MAELQIQLEDNRYKVWLQDLYLEFPTGESNRKVLILLLRSFKKYEVAKQGLFTQEQIAQAMPDFRGATKQSIQDHEHRFSESGRDVQGYPPFEGVSPIFPLTLNREALLLIFDLRSTAVEHRQTKTDDGLHVYRDYDPFFCFLGVCLMEGGEYRYARRTG